MPTLHVLKGLPASGKSTFAKELMGDGNIKRINFDLMREMLDLGAWNQDNEDIIKYLAIEMAGSLLTDGFDVIMDNTNLSDSQNRVNQKIAFDNKAKIEVHDQFLKVPLNVCIQRDAMRNKPVGAKAIKDMWSKYVRGTYKAVGYDPALPECVISDMDGTLSDFTGVRSPYDDHKCLDDNPRHHVVEAVEKMSKGRHLIIVSGRKDSSRLNTLTWLEERAGLSPYRIYMRKTGDARPDIEAKRDIYNEHIKGKYNVMAVFDDRAQVNRLWREVGLGDVLFRVGPVDEDDF